MKFLLSHYGPNFFVRSLTARHANMAGKRKLDLLATSGEKFSLFLGLVNIICKYYKFCQDKIVQYKRKSCLGLRLEKILHLELSCYPTGCVHPFLDIRKLSRNLL